MAEKEVVIPMEFKLVRLNLPVNLDRELGYHGQARFVGLYWDATEDDTAWNDGRESSVGGGDWETFLHYLARYAGHFDANLGKMEEEATHLFVWDRVHRMGYMAPRGLAESFLKSQHAA